MKHNYPKNRKPAKPKQCPYCKTICDARGLHRHILFAHELKFEKKTKVIKPVITKEKEVIPRPITKVITPSITKENQVTAPRITTEEQVIRPTITKVIEVIPPPITKEIASNSSNLSNSANNPVKNEINELLEREGGTRCYDTLDECILAIYPALQRFLESYDVFYCFGKGDLLYEINLLSKKKPGFTIRSYSGQYKLTVCIKADNYNYDYHPYTNFYLKEIRPKLNI